MRHILIKVFYATLKNAPLSVKVSTYVILQSVKGSTDRFDVEIPGRIIRVHLTWRVSRESYCVVNFHGYGFGKKGVRSKIELMENLRERKGLSRKKGNIFGGNFNFVEFKQDRKTGDSRDDFWTKERNIRDFFSVLKKNFSLFVRILISKAQTISIMLYRNPIQENEKKSMTRKNPAM